MRHRSSTEWHITLAVGDELLAERIRRAMLSSDLAARHSGAWITILSAEMIISYTLRAPARLDYLKRRSCLIALVDEAAPGLMLDAMKQAAGYAFHGRNMHHVAEISAIALQGYAALPLSTLSAMLFGRLRLSLLSQLNNQEIHALRLLRDGLSDKQIAMKLEIDISQTKYMMRALMRKLRFNNRTRTAVFAARHLFPASGAQPRF